MNRDLSFRESTKVKILNDLSDMQTSSKEQELERCDLGIRMAKFFQFEEDPEFEEWFDNFCRRKVKETKDIER